MPSHPENIRANVIDISPGFMTNKSRVTVIRYGILFSISTIRCMIISTFPPKYPDTSPYVRPNARSMNTARTAT